MITVNRFYSSFVDPVIQLGLLDEIRSLRNLTQGVVSQDLLNEGAPEMDYSLGIYQAIGTRSKPLARTSDSRLTVV